MSHEHHRSTEPAGANAAAVVGEEYWDARYRESEKVWSGEANAVLAREAEGLDPGRALDLGCGEGGDAVWLARRGWHVTGTDISGIALERAAVHAADAGVEERTEWERHDLAESFPAGEYDLVSACFLHTFGEFPRERILRRAAGAVAPGGILLVVGHAGWASWQEDRPEIDFPTPEQVVAQLELEAGAWEVLLAEEHVRAQDRPDGRPGTRTDNVVKVLRLP